MPMLEHSKRRKIMSSTANLTILAAALVFTGLVLVTSRELNGESGTLLTKAVQLGPIEILEIQKESMPDGAYRIGFAFKAGLVGYIVLWGIIFAAVSQWRLRKAKLQP